MLLCPKAITAAAPGFFLAEVPFCHPVPIWGQKATQMKAFLSIAVASSGLDHPLVLPSSMIVLGGHRSWVNQGACEPRTHSVDAKSGVWVAPFGALAPLHCPGSHPMDTVLRWGLNCGQERARGAPGAGLLLPSAGHWEDLFPEVKEAGGDKAGLRWWGLLGAGCPGLGAML